MRDGRARHTRETGPRRFRSLDLTGNVRVLTPDDLQELAQPVEASLPGADLTSTLPIASYESLSVPALRSRIRSLDAGQLRVLLDHELSNAHRDAVLTMFERKIGRLGAADGDAT